PTIDGPAPPGAGPNRGAIRIGVGNLVGNAVPLSWFATMLSQRLDRLIVDRTNLPGRFDIRLQWAPNAGENPFDQGGNRLSTTITSSFSLLPVSFSPSCFSTADGMSELGRLALSPGPAAAGAIPGAPGGGGGRKLGVNSRVKSYLPVRPVRSMTGPPSIPANL